MSGDDERTRRIQDRIEALRSSAAEHRAEEVVLAAARDVERSHESLSPAKRPERAGVLVTATFYLGLVLSAFVLVQLSMTVAQYTGPDIGDAKRTGQADVQSCQQHGPVGNGFGYWEQCTARVTWDDGTAETVRPDKRGLFSANDVGKTVTIGDLGYGRSGRSLARTELPDRPAIVVASAIPLIIAVLIGMALAWMGWRALRGLVRPSSLRRG